MSPLFENFVRSGRFLKNWSPKTERSYRQAFTSFTQSGATELTKTQLDGWVIWMRQKGMSPGGCNCYIRAMNSFLSWSFESGDHPVQIRLKLLNSPAKALRGFADSEVRLLLSFRPKGFYDLRTWTLVQGLLDTGCRIDEILGLHIQNVDMDNLQLTVTGKGHKERIVPISLELRKLLFVYMKQRIKNIQRETRIVFCCRNGGHMSYRNIYRDIQALCGKAGVAGPHVHPHAFRHCFAVNYIRRGGDLYRLSRILGHTNISTTSLYLRSMPPEQIAEGHCSPLNRVG